MDFYFANRAHAVKFIDFLQTVVPIRYRWGGGPAQRLPIFARMLPPLLLAAAALLIRLAPGSCRHDKQLVSHDVHTSNYNYKYTFSVEIAPLCKVGARPVEVPGPVPCRPLCTLCTPSPAPTPR